jgi:hypothetical protein
MPIEAVVPAESHAVAEVELSNGVVGPKTVVPFTVTIE